MSEKIKKIEVLDSQGNTTGKVRYQPSRRWQAYQGTLEKALQKRRDQTKSYLYAIANKLYSQYDYVAIGDYTPHGNGLTPSMRRAMNNRSLIGRFKEVLSWVALKSGKHYFEYDEKGTTRTCHQCDHKVKEGLSPNVRSWQCENCLCHHIRDENAAINGLYKVLGHLSQQNKVNTLSVPGSGRVYANGRWAWRVCPSGVLCSPRGANRDLSQTPRNQKGRLRAPHPNAIQHASLL